MNRKKVMVVDDDLSLCLLYQEELEEEGYDVTVESDPVEAIRALEGVSPDLVVMDIWNPRMDGIEAMGRMLCIKRDLPVILNSAYSCYKDDFRTWPAVAYVVKSSNLSELKSVIRRSLNLAA